jgi:phosphatidylinositol alpha-mannosyltransferase
VNARGKLDVALLNFGYWPEVQRGNERSVHDLAVELVERGSSATILTSHPGRPSRAIEEGVSVVRSWRPPERLLRMRKIHQNLTHVPFSYRELCRGGFDIAHAFFITDALASTRWAARTGRPAVVTLTGILTRANLSGVRLRKQLLEIAAERSDAVLAVSKANRDAIRRWLGIEARVIYPGVDLAGFSRGKRAPHPTIACAADPGDPRKRVDLLVRAFARVRRDRPDAELLLIRPRDPDLARSLGEREGVRLLPEAVDTAATMFRSAWVSALCAHSEAFGLVLVESMACGTPVVGARDGGVPEIVDRPEVGRLFGGDDEQEVARALLEALELADSPGTAAACRDRAADFSAGNSAEAHISLYRELLGR